MRLYNGCPDDELASVWERIDKSRVALSKEAKKLFGEEARAQCTYFPIYGKYASCLFLGSKYYELSDFRGTVKQSCEDAIKKLHELKGLLPSRVA